MRSEPLKSFPRRCQRPVLPSARLPVAPWSPSETTVQTIRL
jgi:hypothetical protein